MLSFYVGDRQSENPELKCDKQSQNLDIFSFFINVYSLCLRVFAEHFNCMLVLQ